MHRRQLFGLAPLASLAPLVTLAVTFGTALATALVPATAFAQTKDTKEIKIAHIYSKTGPLEAYGKQTATGFMMGLDYATGGTMMVAGKKLVIIDRKSVV